MAAALTKLLLRMRKGLANSHELHRATAESMLVIAAMLRLGENPLMAHPIDADSGEFSVSTRIILTRCTLSPKFSTLTPNRRTRPASNSGLPGSRLLSPSSLEPDACQACCSAAAQ